MHGVRGLLKSILSVNRLDPDQQEFARLLDSDGDAARLLELATAIAKDPAAGHAAFRRLVDATAGRRDRRSCYLLARYNQGALERDAGQHDDAVSTWSEALQHGLDMSDANERFARSVIELNYGDLLTRLANVYDDPERRERALAVFDELVTRERTATLPGMRDRVRRAAINRVLTSAKSGSPERIQAALANLADLAEEWDSDDLRRTATAMSADFARLDEIVAPWRSKLQSEDEYETAAAAYKDGLHQAALQRLGQHQQLGEPFVLLLRSFGTISVTSSSIGTVPVVSGTFPGVSIGHPLEAELVRWLEHRALVVAVAQPDSLLMAEEDAFPRLALGDDWYPFVQTLVLAAEAIVVVATRVSPGLIAEIRAIDSLARTDDTLLVTGPGVDPTAFGSFPLHFAWDGDVHALDRNHQLRAMLDRLERIRNLPLEERVAAADVANRTRAAAAAAHQAGRQPSR